MQRNERLSKYSWIYEVELSEVNTVFYDQLSHQFAKNTVKSQCCENFLICCPEHLKHLCVLCVSIHSPLL